jgi:pyrimidine operon attenuation protein/uracil phosphoribosyltransferase
MEFIPKAKILDKKQIDKLIKRISHQIIEKNDKTEELAIIGIRARGAPLAERIANYMKEFTGSHPLFGTLDITLYRDDLTTIAEQPVIHKTEIDFDISKKTIVLVDDVLYTGRTIRCAMDALIDFGRPRKIQLAVLIDRGHREFPIRPDYVGKNLPTSCQEVVQVRLKEIDGKDEVVLEEKKE